MIRTDLRDLINDHKPTTESNNEENEENEEENEENEENDTTRIVQNGKFN